jgi:hypothetical protein
MRSSNTNREQRNDLTSKVVDGLAVVIPALLGFLLALYIARGSYGRLDDYIQLLNSQDIGLSWFLKTSLSFGRPVTFFVNGVGYEVANQVARLAWMRYAASTLFFLGSLMLAAATFRRSTRGTTALFSLAIFCIPGTWVFITWAQGLGHAVAFLLAVTAGLVLALGTEGRHYNSSFFAFVALTLCVAFSYQTFALAIPGIYFAIGLARSQTCSERYLLRRTMIASLTALSAVAINGLTARATSLETSSSRTEFTTNASAKIEWFSHELLGRALTPFDIVYVPKHADLVLVSLLVVLLVCVFAPLGKRRGPKRLWYVLLPMFVVFLPLLPFAIVDESWASSRAVLPATLVVVLLVSTLPTIAARRAMPFSIWSPWPRRGISIALIIAFALNTIHLASVANESLGRKSQTEWFRVLEEWRIEPVDVSSAKICVVPFIADLSPSAVYSYDEYGLLTGSVSWASPSMHVLAARESGHLAVKLDSIDVVKPTEVCSSDNTLLETGE